MVRHVVRTRLRAVAAVTSVLVLGGGGFAAADHPGDVDCGDFAYQQDAQEHMDAHPGDPDRLDGNDDDGLACESLPSRPAEPAPPPPPPPPVVVPRARAVDDSCPAGVVAEDGFLDVATSSPFEGFIDCVRHWEVTTGTSATTYSPLARVTREQMAAFVARTLRATGSTLPERPADAFRDDEGSHFEREINQLAAVGVVNGTSVSGYSPRALVTRAQMAAFLVRTYEHRSGDDIAARVDYFPDDEGLGLERAVDAAAEVGFTGGYADGTYRPRESVRRDHMAAFLTRLLDLVVEQGLATVPGARVAPPAEGTAAAVLAALPVEPENGPGYDREVLFGGWVDADGDGCDTRSEVLQRDSLVPVTVGSGCVVVTGRWVSAFDGAEWSRASDVDIDHLVPLAEAWASGGYTDGWSAERRGAYANDLDLVPALQAVTDEVNQSKGDRDPAEWLPPRQDARCGYAVEWVAVKAAWGLSVDSAEKRALQGLLSGGCGQTAVPS